MINCCQRSEHTVVLVVDSVDSFILESSILTSLLSSGPIFIAQGQQTGNSVIDVLYAGCAASLRYCYGASVSHVLCVVVEIFFDLVI
jgi:hypothetical protein